MQTANLEALDHYLKGQKLYARYTRDGNVEAILEFALATKSDSQFARARSWEAYAQLENYKQNFADKDDSIRLANECASEALALSPYDYFTHWTNAAILMELKDMPGAHREYNIAISLVDGPNPDMLIEMADMLSFEGDSIAAINQIEKAKNLTTIIPPCYSWSLALAHFQDRDYSSAVTLLESLPELANEAYLMLAISKAKLNAPIAPDDIKSHMFARDPLWTTEHLDRMPFVIPADQEHWMSGLNTIGI